MGFGIDRRARSRKAKGGLRALIGRAPDSREVGERLMRIVKRMLRGSVTDASAKRITLDLHPAASPVRIVVLPDGDLEVRGETSTVGPGYHADVIARLAPVLEELDYVWDGDEPDPRTAMAAWFAAELVRGATKIGMPSDRSFVVDGAAVQTALGPRDRAWCDAVIADPARAADAFPWWTDGPGERERSLALCAMWQEIAWREPIDADERTAMERVDADLRAARAANKKLALPWAPWAELLDWLGEDEDKVAELRARAGEGAQPIGYRRYPMDVELSGGWSLEMPGSFVGAWEDDGARYWATDGDRVLEFTSLTANTAQTSQELLDIAPEAHPVLERIAEDRRCGRAEGYDEGDVHIVHGLMTAAPEIAILTCKGSLADEPWALATWRSLIPS